MELLGRIVAGLRATSLPELASLVLGIGYALLAVRQRRECWLFGGASSLLLVWLAAKAGLPMQALLQAWYVGMAAYGWYSWTRHSAREGGRIRRWPPAWHLAAIAGIVTMSALSARVLAVETHAAWPWIDSLTT